MTVAIPTDVRFKDLTGQSFGRWEVLEYAGRRKRNHQWLCRCACGTEKAVPGANLKNGRTISCGCSKRESLVGREFGRLVVKSLADVVDYGRCTAIRWNCKCSCGNRTVVFANALQQGATVSCGCYGAEQRRKSKESRL